MWKGNLPGNKMEIIALFVYLVILVFVLANTLFNS